MVALMAGGGGVGKFCTLGYIWTTRSTFGSCVTCALFIGGCDSNPWWFLIHPWCLLLACVLYPRSTLSFLSPLLQYFLQFSNVLNLGISSFE